MIASSTATQIVELHAPPVRLCMEPIGTGQPPNPPSCKRQKANTVLGMWYQATSIQLNLSWAPGFDSKNSHPVIALALSCGLGVTGPSSPYPKSSFCRHHECEQNADGEGWLWRPRCNHDKQCTKGQVDAVIGIAWPLL